MSRQLEQAQTDRLTDSQTDRKIKFVKTLKLCWKVLKNKIIRKNI